MRSIKNGICSVEDCDKEVMARHMCSRHYKQFIRKGGSKINKKTICLVEECGRRNHAKGYCKVHYGRILRHSSTARLTEDHGLEKTKEYRAWVSIKQRCLNPNNHAYTDYGSRGITIAEEWKHSFLAFYTYIGKSPSPKHSVERIEVDGNYAPGNVVWALNGLQSHNQRIRSTNKSGHKGVYWREDSKKWVASVAYEGKKYHLGLFDTAEQAALAYQAKSQELYSNYEQALPPEFRDKELEKKAQEKRHTKNILCKINREGFLNDCWEWIGTIADTGYGQVYLDDRTQMAHRAVYQILIGSIPGDMQLNHDCHSRDKKCAGGVLCPHRRCVNPDHMRRVTPLENLQLDDTISSQNAKKEHCLRGHKYTSKNTRVSYISGAKVRYCLACDKIRNTRALNKRQQQIDAGEFTPPTSESVIGQTCSKGHVFDSTNTHITKRGHVQCRACSRERSTVKNARVKAARLAAGGLNRSGPRPKTHCKWGHLLDEKNLYIQKSNNRRMCRVCLARIARANRAKHRV